MKLGFLASHRGTMMQAVLDAIAQGRLAAESAVLICNNRGAEAIGRAEQAGVVAHVLNGKTHPEPDSLDRAIADTLQAAECDLVILGGYLKRLGPRVLEAFAGRILNIHPSLLPRHGGPGMYGLNVHRAVLADGDRKTGISIHLVDAEYDHGRVLAQLEVPVVDGETPETLAERIRAMEQDFLVETLDRICRGTLLL